MILCCGEALIDMLPTPTLSGHDGYVPHAGGAVFNTAIALGRLGVRTAMLTGLSRDIFGQQLAEALRASHVDTSHVILSDRATTLAFVRLQQGQAAYSFYDENSAGRMLSVEDLPTLSDDISALFFGGISLACEPGATAYQALLEREGARRAVMIDPNIRPTFIEDEARYRKRLETMLRRADIVKVSDEDLHWIDQSRQPLRNKALDLLKGGPALVIVTEGAEGASAYLQSGAEVHAPVQRVQIVDTVGAGDTFNAGVLAKLSELGALHKPGLRDLTPDMAQAALTQGARAAAVTVSRAGANPPWAGEL